MLATLSLALLPQVIFMAPEGKPSPGALPVYRRVTDPGKLATYGKWIENDSARHALELYALARGIAAERGLDKGQPPGYYIALIPDGNNGALGFRLDGEEYPRTPYMQLDAQEWRFGTTLLHENGHVVLLLLSGGRMIPRRQIASIPHTTAALSDRGTAFDEGFGIHLETLGAHLGWTGGERQDYVHRRFLFGSFDLRASEYHRHASDLLTFSQSVARYLEVRDNNFAFESAFTGADYLRIQMEKPRDFATLRDANQLLESEGFYASFFFSLLMRGDKPPSETELKERQARMLEAIAEMFSAKPFAPDAPHLLHFVETYAKRYPDEAQAVFDVLLDLSHGVFVDREAATLWREHYLAALRLDLAGLNRERIQAARERWRSAVKDPAVLYSRLGPQIRCVVTGPTVRLVAMGKTAPLAFDVNTVQPGVLRLIPGITAEEVRSWLAKRAERPFRDLEDFRTRAGLAERTLASLRFPG